LFQAIEFAAHSSACRAYASALRGTFGSRLHQPVSRGGRRASAGPRHGLRRVSALAALGFGSLRPTLRRPVRGPCVLARTADARP